MKEEMFSRTETKLPPLPIYNVESLPPAGKFLEAMRYNPDTDKIETVEVPDKVAEDEIKLVPSAYYTWLAQEMVNKMARRRLEKISQLRSYCATIFTVDPELLVYEFETPQIEHAETYKDGNFLCVLLCVGDKMYAGMSKRAVIDKPDEERGLEIAMHRAIEKFFPPEF